MKLQLNKPYMQVKCRKVINAINMLLYYSLKKFFKTIN